MSWGVNKLAMVFLGKRERSVCVERSIIYTLHFNLGYGVKTMVFKKISASIPIKLISEGWGFSFENTILAHAPLTTSLNVVNV